MSDTRLVSYQHIWIHKDCDGWQYSYRCKWSDGSETMNIIPSRSAMEQATELPMTGIERKPVTLDAATKAFCAMLAERNKEMTI